MSDVEKSPDGETLGQILRSAREAAGLTTRHLAETTRVQEKCVIALEEGDYRSLPEPVYQRMFLRTLARTLGIPEQDLLERHRAELDRPIAAAPAGRPPQTVPRSAFLVAPRLLSGLLIAAVTAIALLVFGIQAYRIVAPPALELSAPTDGLESIEASVAVAGATEPGAELRVNGEPVFPNPDGSFAQIVLLHRGVNVIKISAKKRHSDELVLYRRVLWNGPTTTTP